MSEGNCENVDFSGLKNLQKKFSSLTFDKKIVILGIQDDYKYMDAELIEILEASVSLYLDL